jgi:ankyrin repeat protein
MSLPLPPQSDDPIIAQFKPRGLQWELTDDNINRIDPRTGYTILHNYCFYINTTPLEVYRYLIEVKGCDVNAQDNDNDTPIHRALRYFSSTEDGADITVLMYLLSQKDLSVNTKGQYDWILLHTACININTLPLDIFNLLIETLGYDVNAQDIEKRTPLYDALLYFDPNEGGNITVLTYLLSQKGVNGDTNDTSRYPLLHMVCKYINKLPLDIFNLLIETLGYDVNVQSEDKDTPLHNALLYFDPNEGGDINTLTYLLNQKGVNVDISSEGGFTLLHIACQCINRFPIDVFKLLIEKHGSDVNVQDNYKDTPLHYALRDFNLNKGGDITVLTYLLTQKDINVNIKGDYGYTLLHMACFNINALPIEIFKLLIETDGGDVNARGDDNKIPIHRALCCFNSRNGGDISVLQYLLSQTNVDVNVKAKRGRTLLHAACLNIKRLPLDIFKLLVETHGADVNAQDIYNDTPLHRALAYFNPYDGGDITVLMYLFNRKDVSVNINDRNGHTLLHSACICDTPDLYEYMDSDDDCVDSNDDYMAPEDNFTDSEGNLDNHREARAESFLCQIVEALAETCVQQVLDATTP